ncbi:MAG: enoyl-CoA hydratase/isomerase family protein [Propionibacteriaceae bacterium]|nr:enoyl-CoA hydratase/isomerase family protein [Propionibacteriaceae bacterium]
MNDSEILVDRDGAIATVTMNRPHKLNSLSPSMYEHLITAFRRLSDDDSVRVVILTGAGRSFCAGSDIASLTDLHHSHLPVRAEQTIASFPKPVIAAIRGNCLGGGCQLATAADIRLAADDSHFGIPPAKLGIVYPLSATRRLISLIGPAGTKYLIYTGDRINATRALHLGLVDELVMPGLLWERAQQLAVTIASRSQLTLQATKQIVDAHTEDTLTEELVSSWVREAACGPDLPEGMAAFAARRPPSFTWTHPRSGG